MIAAWEVVAVLVPLCSASAATGYAYAKRLGEIERDPPDAAALLGAPPVPASPRLTPSLPTGPTPGADSRVRLAAAPDPGAIDLGERLRPFTAPAPVAGSAGERREPDPPMSQSPQSALNERMIAPDVARDRARGA